MRRRGPARRRAAAALVDGSPSPASSAAQVLVERGDAVVVEARGDRAEHRHVLPRRAERLAVAHELAADVAAGVLGAAALELVDRDDVGEVEHVDLLELGRGAELGRHHVQRARRRTARSPASPWPMPGVSTITRSKPAALQRRDDVGERARAARRRRRGWPATGRRRSSPVEAFIRIRSPSSAPPPLRRVGSTASTAMRSLSSWSSRKRRTSSSVSEDFPEPPVPVMPSTGTVAARRAAGRASAGSAPGLGERDGAGQRGRVARVAASSKDAGRLRGEVDVALRDHQVDHPGQAEALAVLGGEDARDAALVQQLDLARHDHAAAAAVDPDVPGAALAQQLDEVAEVLDVAALVGADRDALRVLLDRGRDDLVDRAVVAEVDHLGALACRIRRMMLIAASWPSNRLAAVTKRTGCAGTCRSRHDDLV